METSIKRYGVYRDHAKDDYRIVIAKYDPTIGGARTIAELAGDAAGAIGETLDELASWRNRYTAECKTTEALRALVHDLQKERAALLADICADCGSRVGADNLRGSPPCCNVCIAKMVDAMPPSMLVVFPAIRQLPYRVARYREDGWPICPHCDEDELYSLAGRITGLPSATPETVAGCYRCGPCSVKEAI